MSRLLDFIVSILPRIKKDDVLEDLRITTGELEQGVIPSYTDSVKFFKSEKAKSEEVVAITSVFSRNYGKSVKGNLISEIESNLKDLHENLKFVSKEIEELLEHDIIKEGLTAKKTILLRAAEHFSFITRFSMDLLNYIYIYETKAAGAEHDELVPALKNGIEQNIMNFARLYAAYSDRPTAFQKLLNNLPDVVVNEKTYESLAAVYRESLDPLPSVFSKGFENNPIYHLRLVLAEYQANRYKSFKDKKRMLELRLLNLKMVADDNPDPKVQQEIVYIQSRIEGIEYKMRRMEESV